MSEQLSQPAERQKPSMFLLDGMALVFRSYYALMSARMQTQSGFPTGAIYGFINTILKIEETYRPDFLVVAFDSKEKTFRHEAFPDYKAQRPAPPTDLIQQLGKILEIVPAMGIPMLKRPGFEADDIIGTLTKKFEDRCNLFLVTPDKDFAQLVHDGVKLLKPARQNDEFLLYGAEEVKSHYGVYPEQFLDMLALMGDSSDNIPGAPGIGPKTAANLINRYGSIAKIYENLYELRPRARESLLKSKAALENGRFLMTIKTDMDIDLTLDDLKQKSPDLDFLLPLFEELEFRTLAARFKSSPEKKNEQAASDADLEFNFGANVDPNFQFAKKQPRDLGNYTLIQDEDDLNQLAEKLGSLKEFAFDTETTSLTTLDAELVGISFSFAPGEAFFVYCAESALSRETAIRVLKPILENPEIGKIGQNLKYDMLVLKNYGVRVQPVRFDTMLASYVLNPDKTHNLDDLAADHLGLETVKYADLVGKGKSEKSIYEVEPKTLSDYACQDADVALQLKNVLEKALGENEPLKKICEELEFPLVGVLADMEHEGVRLDVAVLKTLSETLGTELGRVSKIIYDAAGEAFNLDSPKQLSEILFEKLKLPAKRRTKTGYSTDVRVLEELAESFPVAKQILEYRSLQKLKSTYVDALPNLVHPKTGRIHTSFNQHIAATGRLSSSNPNLQNIPIRTEIGREIRGAFVPSDAHHTLLSADYSQIELRIAAELSGDPTMLGAFQNREDIHSTTAKLIFETDEVTKDMRRKAKEVNFGVLYGIMPFGLAQRLDISQAEAKEIISQYKEKYPMIFSYLEGILDKARASGYVETLLGRRRYIRDLNSKNFSIRSAAERAAINTPIQGTAADMIKKAMLGIASDIHKQSLRSRMILQVHDELLFNMHESEVDILPELVQREMIEAAKAIGIRNVPIEVEVGTGANWIEAH
ncbi:DNA polymerase I [Chloroherpeton thalassium ATCC 35110]|uniref:DNA polymerase I n=1 Tax=Chloroherpeton thalassium (strain ATCC 35110 / GB-78) TaxID=517418 RepID=B3QYB9_CHLT3|nr:DNA polymerase I [Chloroherpeton thalassium]ACF15085.1 DNA polymerase I [Chloroherpeton thalassium ATCC 35110]